MRYGSPACKIGPLLGAIILAASSLTTVSASQAVLTPALAAAMKELAKTEQPSEKLMTNLAILAQKEPENYQAHFLLAICYQRMGLPDQALPELKLAAQYGPDDPAPILGLIREAVQSGQRDLAMQIADVAYHKFPTNPEASFWQANFVLQKGNRLGEANALFNKVVRSGMQIPKLKLSLAQLRLAERKYDEALSLASEQLLESPNTPGAWLIEGDIYMLRSDYQKAYLPLKMAYAKLVFSPGLARKYAEAAFWTGHYEETIEPAIVQLALVSTKVQSDKTTEMIFKQAAVKVPREKLEAIVNASSEKLDTFRRYIPDPAFHRVLAVMLSSIGIHKLALTEFERELKRDPDDATTNFLMGKELETYFGRYDQALACYQKAKLQKVQVEDIDLYIEHLQTRMRARHGDIAWQLKDWLYGN